MTDLRRADEAGFLAAARAGSGLLLTEGGHFEALVAVVQDGLLECDLDGAVCAVNDRFLEMTGFAREELVGTRPPLPHWPPRLHATYLAARVAVQYETPTEYPVLYCRKDGSEFPATICVSAVVRSDGRQVGTLTMVRDRSEERQRRRALQRSEERFRALVQHSSDLIVVFDVTGRITYVSPSVERLLGYAEQDVLGVPVFDYMHPAERGDSPTLVASTPAEPGASVRLERRALHADGTWREFELVASNLLDDPAVRGIVVAARDITERRRVEEALRERELALAALATQHERQRLADQIHRVERLESLGRLAGGVAHDFNNLLGVIDNHASFVAKRLAGTDPLRDDVERIRDATRKATELTRQLLLFGRRDMGEMEVLDPNLIVADTVALMRRPLGDRIEITSVGGPVAERIAAPRGRVDQVLVNLLLNARDAMPDGGTVTVRLSTRSRGVGDRDGRPPATWVVLEVRDTGVGMPDAVVERACEPFFTTKPTGHGTGLGLAAAYGVVEGLGGTVLIDSTVGVGTTVSVELPAVELAPRAGSAATQATR